MLIAEISDGAVGLHPEGDELINKRLLFKGGSEHFGLILAKHVAEDSVVLTDKKSTVLEVGEVRKSHGQCGLVSLEPFLCTCLGIAVELVLDTCCLKSKLVVGTTASNVPIV